MLRSHVHEVVRNSLSVDIIIQIQQNLSAPSEVSRISVCGQIIIL